VHFFARPRGQLNWSASASEWRDAEWGNSVPHFAQAAVERLASDTFRIDGVVFKLGSASGGLQNNCLIDALRQCCSAALERAPWTVSASVVKVRSELRVLFPAGEQHEVLEKNFLTLNAHWRPLLMSLLGMRTLSEVDAGFRIWCLDVRPGASAIRPSVDHGDAVGSGAVTLRLARTGENHFVPLIRTSPTHASASASEHDEASVMAAAAAGKKHAGGKRSVFAALLASASGSSSTANATASERGSLSEGVEAEQEKKGKRNSSCLLCSSRAKK
jgi:hypothetical protein